jgi:hypothetical protein
LHHPGPSGITEVEVKVARATNPNQEAMRLQEGRATNVPWRKWGPYLSERQWGTVREDDSQDGNALTSHQTGWTGRVAKLLGLFGRLDGDQFLAAGKNGGFTRKEMKEEEYVEMAQKSHRF